MLILKKIENYLLIAIPALGLGIVILYQIGRYIALGVPVEFLELDPVRTFISALTIALFSTASLAMLTVFYQREDKPARKYRYLYHLAAVTVLTLPFWSDEVGLKSSIDWGVIIYILGVSVITTRSHMYLDQVTGKVPYTEPKSSKAFDLFGFIFWNILVISLSTVLLGGHFARTEDTRLVLSGTNQIFVGKYNGMLIFKDPTLNISGDYVHHGIKLVPPSDSISIEERSNIPLGR